MHPSAGRRRFRPPQGDCYATILVDLETRRPVDVLPGRDAEPLAQWLRGHPEIEVICRDRASAYAEGARSGASQALQVADGWHLWHNLGEALEKTVGAHYHCVRAVFAAPRGTAAPPSKGLVGADQAAPALPEFRRMGRWTGPDARADW
ncbi:transposase [Streptomyces sp. NPDC057686]|uniref:transposase n=1 Tax=Streptomyces sp. NPDC057686 TaxID=3346212 RepID=UPI0036806FA5